VFTPTPPALVREVLAESPQILANVWPAQAADEWARGFVEGLSVWLRTTPDVTPGVRRRTERMISEAQTVVGLPRQRASRRRALALAKCLGGVVFDGSVLLDADGAVIASRPSDSRSTRARPGAERKRRRPESTVQTATTSDRVAFGYKTSWLAIASNKGDVVARTLGLRGVEPADWSGVERSYDQGVFVTPAVAGWTLVVGVDLAVPENRVDIAALSSDLDAEVQWFVSHRVVELHGWERATAGTLRRRFEYVGEASELVANWGELTQIERELHIPDAVTAAPGPYALDVVPDENTVMAVAGSWSVDPTRLSGLDESVGWFGFL